MFTVGVAMIIGRMADIEAVNENLNIIFTTLFIVAGVVALLMWAIADTISPSSGR